MKIKQFYVMVALFTAIDLAVNVALIWSSLAVTGSPFVIGAVSSLSVLIPFGLKYYFARNGKLAIIHANNLHQTLIARVFGYLLIAVLFLTIHVKMLLVIVLAAFISGILNFITMSFLEGRNTLFVLEKKIPKENAARYMETCIQIGACLGAFIGGILIARFSLLSTINVLSVAAIVSAAIVLHRYKEKKIIPPTIKDKTAKDYAELSQRDARAITLLSVAMGVIGFHIGSFNILVPIVYQQLHHWSAAFFGFASATAGVGAFLATLLPNKKRLLPACCVLLFIADAVIVLSQNLMLSIAFSFFIGFCINYIRINIRENLIHLSHNPQSAHRIASLSMVNYLFFRGLSPLLVSMIVSTYVFGMHSTPLVFTSIGIFSAVFFLSLHYTPKNYRLTTREIIHE